MGYWLIIVIMIWLFMSIHWKPCHILTSASDWISLYRALARTRLSFLARIESLRALNNSFYIFASHDETWSFICRHWFSHRMGSTLQNAKQSNRVTFFAKWEFQTMYVTRLVWSVEFQRFSQPTETNIKTNLSWRFWICKRHTVFDSDICVLRQAFAEAKLFYSYIFVSFVIATLKMLEAAFFPQILGSAYAIFLF